MWKYGGLVCQPRCAGVEVWQTGVSAEMCCCGSVVKWCVIVVCWCGSMADWGVSRNVLLWQCGELVCQPRCAGVEVWWTGVSAQVC